VPSYDLPPGPHDAGRTDRVAVVGGGVIGCAVARELAPDHEVVVVERGRVAGGATARAAGLITMTPSYSDLPSISDPANGFFRAYDGTRRFRYTERESVEPIPPDREGEARRRVERLSADGVAVSFVESGRLAERYPRIDTSGVVGAVAFEGTGWVDPYTFATTLRDDAVERGAEFRTDTTVDAVRVENDAVTGVETGAGVVEADAIVAAAGWRTADLLADVVALPIRPYRTQCVVVDPGEDASDLPIGWLPDDHVYWRPEHNGDLLLGGWSVAEDDPEGASRDEDEAFRQHAAELLPGVFEGTDDAAFVDGWAGVDGATPDTRPIVDAPADAPEGLVVATGFHGRGVMTAPVASRGVRALLAGEDPGFPLSTFALDRFDSRSREFEFVSISA
jgi:glycine/D-amino acid oxidase-like deaminating enzyme